MNFRDWFTHLVKTVEASRNDLHTSKLQSELESITDDIACIEILANVAAKHPETTERVAARLNRQSIHGHFMADARAYVPSDAKPGTELHFLRWFVKQMDFGPRQDNTMDHFRAAYVRDHKCLVPCEWR